MEASRASLCNVVINFLLEEHYLLTAFELLHELSEDGHADRATRLQEFFADPSLFPPDDIHRMQQLQVANPQRLVEERDAAEERFAIKEYELRLALEDIKRLKEKLESNGDFPFITDKAGTMDAKEKSYENVGPLRESERKNLNRAIKEYLLTEGYKLSAMTFYEEVNDQDLDSPGSGPACIPDALRHYYLHFMSDLPDAIEEKTLLQEKISIVAQEKEILAIENGKLLKNMGLLEAEKISLMKSLEAAQMEAKDKEKQIRQLKSSLEQALKDSNECRMEITSLKLDLERARVSKGHEVYNNDSIPLVVQERVEGYKAEIESLKIALETLKEKRLLNEMVSETMNSADLNACLTIEGKSLEETTQAEVSAENHRQFSHSPSEDTENVVFHEAPNGISDVSKQEVKNDIVKGGFVEAYDELRQESGKYAESSKQEHETVEILADALPKIVPYVLINHREELLPLMMCAIERHPSSQVRDLLTHTLFNLIKRPDENQRRIIMDACVSLAQKIGKERTEQELLPQCWEQINHKYEERRLLVAQSCGEIALFVKPDMRASLILSIVQQLVEDPAVVVREAAAHNLTLLLPLFPNMDKYFKVEELMFQLGCDPSGIVSETALKELVPAVVTWAKNGNQPLSQILRALLSRLLTNAQRCPPLSGVEGSLEAQLRVLGEKERWNIDVLLKMLKDLLPQIRELVISTHPSMVKVEGDATNFSDSFFSESVLQAYLRGSFEWPAFDWLHYDCLPTLIQLARMLPSREDSVRTNMSKVLLATSDLFGSHYLSSVILPLYLFAVGDTVDISHLPSGMVSRMKGFQPKTSVGERLVVLCVLPLLLAGVLGAPSMQDKLADYLKKLVLLQASKHGALTAMNTPEIIDAIRFLGTFDEHHEVIMNVLWELVVSANEDVKISAASIFKVLVAYVDIKLTTQHVLPALVTLGTDPNLHVKYSSIDAFGAVAQHFKDEVIVEKIRVQMDAFLEDGSHEAAVAVVRALAVAVPMTTSSLRDYLLQKLLLLTGAPLQGTSLMKRREKADAFCEALRALDATDVSVANVRDLLLPAIQNLMKDPEALDPAHKEALETIVKERSGGRLDALTKAMGTHLSMTGVTSLFGDTGFLGKKDSDFMESSLSHPPLQQQQEEGRLRRMIRGNFGEKLWGKGKANEELRPPTP